MNTVEPLRGTNTIERFARVLKSYSDRDYVLFLTGLYLGRRISDILKLRVRDVKGKDYIYFREAKKNKESNLKVNKKLKAVLTEYCEDKKDYEYLFRPLRGNENRPITRQEFWHILNKAAAELGYTDKIGCHSLRKTLGRELYQQGVDIVKIMLVLNQDDVNYTKRYIGVTEDEVTSVLDKVDYGL